MNQLENRIKELESENFHLKESMLEMIENHKKDCDLQAKILSGLRKRHDKLIELCVEVYAHCELDYEVTLAGNGTNASEASNFADEVLEILEVKKKKIEKEISKEVKELKNLYDEDDTETIGWRDL